MTLLDTRPRRPAAPQGMILVLMAVVLMAVEGRRAVSRQGSFQGSGQGSSQRLQRPRDPCRNYTDTGNNEIRSWACMLRDGRNNRMFSYGRIGTSCDYTARNLTTYAPTGWVHKDNWQDLIGTTIWYLCMQGEITWPTPYFPPVFRTDPTLRIVLLSQNTKITVIRPYPFKLCLTRKSDHDRPWRTTYALDMNTRRNPAGRKVGKPKLNPFLMFCSRSWIQGRVDAGYPIHKAQIMIHVPTGRNDTYLANPIYFKFGYEIVTKQWNRRDLPTSSARPVWPANIPQTVTPATPATPTTPTPGPRPPSRGRGRMFDYFF